MTQPAAPSAGAPEPTGTPAPAVPVVPGQQPEPGSGPTPTDPAIQNPEAKRYADEAAALRTRLRKLEADHAKLVAAGQTDAEKALAAAKVEGAKEYQTKWQQAMSANAALTLLAERRVSATDLALRALDLSSVEVNPDTGEVDLAALTKLVDGLIEKYPMLVGNGSPVGPLSGADQRRIQQSQMVRPAANSSEELNKLARFALGAD